MDAKTETSTDSSNVPVDTATLVDVRHITTQQLAALGMTQIAYLKPVVVNGMVGVAIHAADGTAMAVADTRDLAAAVVMQHEMLPLSVH